MKILWYGKWENVDGNHVYMKTLSGIQADRGHGVTVAYFGDHRTNMEDRHPRISYLPLPYVCKSQPWTLSHQQAAGCFRDILVRCRPDVVHASLAVGSLDLRLSEICRQAGIPWVATFHISFANHLDPYALFSYVNHLIYRRPLLAAAKVVIFSERQKEYLASRLNIPPDRMEIIPNGVHTDAYTPGTSTLREKIDADFVVGYFGRLAPEKNVGKLCKAFLNLRDRGSSLVIMGKGVSQRRLRRRYGGHPRIVFTGHRSMLHEKIDILRAFDAFVLPSSIEGFSLSLLEAMSCAVPPVVTDVGGNAEIVRGCGIIVHPKRILKGVEEALRDLRRDPRRRASMGARARKRVLSHLPWQENCTRLEEIYHAVTRR